MMLIHGRDPTPPARVRGVHGTKSARGPLAAVCVLALAALPAPPAAAQADAPPAGTVAGLVLDGATGDPIMGAVVTLEPAAGGLVVEGRTRGGAAAARSLVTPRGGSYRFADLAPGRYRLRVERLGYRGVTVEVDLRRPVDAAVSVGLELEPVVLEPARGRARPGSIFRRAANAPFELDEARVASERARQAMFLSPDARVVTYADVMDGVTLGEGDVFRALQRFPGVGTRDDYTAEIWTRGAPWTHTRVTFDGVPLFNPVHAVGLLSAVPTEVLGAVFFHPGVQPASEPGGAAGAVELRTRPGGGHGAVRGVADLSLATAGIALDQDIAGRGSWVVAGRRSHLGVLSNGLGGVGLDTLDLPYRFHDVTGRVDLELGERARIEASGIWEEDRLHGDVDGVLERTRASWGNAAGRVTLRAAVAGVEVSQTVGGSHFRARTDEHRVRTREAARAWTEPASRNEVRHVLFAGTVAPASPDSAAAPWALGYDLARYEAGYQGPLPRFHAVRPDTAGLITRDAARTDAGAWAVVRIRAAERVVVSPGVRVEAGQGIRGAGSVRVSPRVAARWALSPDVSVSAAAGRSWQYLQAIALAGPSIHPAFHASHFWVLADDRAPAVRADLASVGAEAWLGGGWLASGTVFVRRAVGVTVPDPEPGRLRGRPLFVDADNRARGMDASLRRIGARWSVAVGYSHAVSELEAAGWRYPSPADRRHMLDAMAGVRVTPSLRLAGAFTAMSGAPFTRAYTRSAHDCDAFGFGCDNPEGSWVEEPNAARTPPYHGLDASLQWARPVGGVELGAYLQVRNVLGRRNATTYAGTVPAGRLQDGAGTRVVWDDRFEPGLPRLPLVGFRVTF